LRDNPRSVLPAYFLASKQEPEELPRYQFQGMGTTDSARPGDDLARDFCCRNGVIDRISLPHIDGESP
jgi:hypothetical protein